MSVRKVAALLGGGEQKLELGQKPGQVPALFQKPKKLSRKGKKTFNAFKKKFDPSTIANMMGKPLGDTTSYGLTGKNTPGGNKTAKPDIKISPDTIKSLMDIDKANHTKITEDQGQRMKTGDGVADILAKIVNFMKKSREEVVKQREITDLQREEQEAKEKREQAEFLQSIGNKNKTGKTSSSGGASEPGETPLEVKGTNLENVSKVTRVSRPATASRVDSRNQSPSTQRTTSDESKGSSLLSNITSKVTGLISEAASTVGSLAVGGAAKVGSFLKGSGGTTAATAGIAATGVAPNLGSRENGTGKFINSGLFTKIPQADGSVEVREGGDVAWRNNNPGNIIWSDFARKQGAIGASGSFDNGKYQYAVFPTREMGEKAREQLLLGGNSRYYKPNTTIAEAMRVYGGDTTGNYAAYVAKAIGVSTQTTIGQLNKEQGQQWMAAISRFERNIPGKVSIAKNDGTTVVPPKQSMTQAVTSMPSVTEKTGEKLDKTTKENLDGKKDMKKGQNAVIINNTQTVLNNRSETRINIFHEPLSTDNSPFMDYQNMAVPYQELKW